jgi:hypothetical protein
LRHLLDVADRWLDLAPVAALLADDDLAADGPFAQTPSTVAAGGGGGHGVGGGAVCAGGGGGSGSEGMRWSVQGTIEASLALRPPARTREQKERQALKARHRRQVTPSRVLATTPLQRTL